MQASVAPEGAQPPNRFRNRFVPALGMAGAGLLVYMIAALGPARIVAQLQGLGSILPAVLALTGVKYPLQTAGWRLALPRRARPPWGQSIGATITGDALGYLTWAGPITGEPIRALLVRGSAPVASGIAAGAVERGVYHVTAGLLVWAVLVFLSTTHRMALVVALAGSFLGVTALIWLVRRRIRARLAGSGRPGRRAVFLEAIDDLWRERRGALPAIAVLCLAQHAILVAEAYLMLNTLSGATTLQTAFVFEAVTKIVNTAGLVVPGRLGIAEGGSALLAGALGFAASHGLSLALMRRVRALIWAAVGLVLLPFQEARARGQR